MITYADYNYYEETYNGDLDEETFDKIVVRASAFIRSLVNGKLETEDYDIDDYEEVKWAVCEMCDAAYEVTSSAGNEGGRLVNSVSNDGYSVSYAYPRSGSTMEAAVNDRYMVIARKYLAETGLLSRCVYPLKGV